nr:hypothetical protein [Candidatus Sigynarchaeum springense]
MGFIVQPVDVFDRVSKRSSTISTKFDTAAGATMIRESAAKFCTTIPDIKRGWKGVGGGEMTSEKYCSISVKIGGRIIPDTAYVVPDVDISADMLFGAPGLQRGDVVLHPRLRLVAFISDFDQPGGDRR